MSCGITLLVCTWNRARDLRDLLASALAQDTGGRFTYELVVVNNNSSDETERVVEGFLRAAGSPLRYFVEKRQGKSYALNTALMHARGEICAIGDDDLVLPPDYLRRLWETFAARPDISIVGGRVEPLWSTPPPRWLTPRHWGAIALTDYGEVPFETGRERPACLLAAAFRRADLARVGEYDVGLGVSRGVIGGMEDAEIYLRMYAAGMRGLYDPSLHLFHKVEPHRARKSYHRRWHFGHGRQEARLPDTAAAEGRFTLFGVPSYVLRQGLGSACQCVLHLVRGNAARAFDHEIRLWSAAGFAWERARFGRRASG